MPKKENSIADTQYPTELLKKLLILELFKLGVPQSEISKKLKMDIHGVNAFLKGIKRTEKQNGKD